MGGRNGAWLCLNPEETQRPELRRHSVIMLFHDCATHWSDHIVRLSFISNISFVMTALLLWRGMLVWHDTERLPDILTNNPGWLNDASPLQACFAWAKDVIFDVLKQEGNTHCVKATKTGHRGYDEPTLLTIHTVGGRWQLSSGAEIHDFCVTTWCKTPFTSLPRQMVPSVFLFPILVPRTCWQQADWHTH